MIIFFDENIIDNDIIAELTATHEQFNEIFKLGSVASQEVKLKVLKTGVVEIPKRVLIDDTFTQFNLVVDKIEEDEYFYYLTLTDRMIEFNFRYDASSLIDRNKENEQDTYLQDILNDICLQVGIECNYTLKNENIVIDWYDNRILAREYLSYIAELEGCFLRITDNELEFVEYGNSVATYDSSEVEEIVLIEEFTIATTTYDNGVDVYSFSEGEGNTLYINPDNQFVVNENQIEFIHDKIKGFNFWSMEVSRLPIDSTIKAGDIVTFTHGLESFDTIVQYDISFMGKWNGKYSLDLDSQKQIETQVIGIEDKVRTIRTIVNRTDASLSIVAEQVAGNVKDISDLTVEVGSISSTVGQYDGILDRVSLVEQKAESIDFSIKTSGGYNLIKNSVGYFDSDWDNLHNTQANTDIQQNTLSHSAWLLLNKTSEQEVQVPNGEYTLSFKYRKLLQASTVKVILTTNEPHEIELDFNDSNWTEKTYTFTVTNNSFKIALVSNHDNTAFVSDLIVAVGDLPSVWTMANGESITGDVKIGGGYIEITSDTTKVKQVSDSTGNRFYNTTTGEVVTEYTSEGMETKSLKADKGEIGKLLIVEIGDQTTLTRI